MERELVCPICKYRVSEYAMVSGLTVIITCHIVHKICMEDYKLRHGHSWTPFLVGYEADEK